MKPLDPLAAFLLGLMIGAGLYRSYRHRQDEEDTAYLESLSSSSDWDGEDPLPEGLLRMSDGPTASTLQAKHIRSGYLPSGGGSLT